MEKWEYQTRFFEAKATDKQIQAYIESEFDKKARRYSPESMIPELNALGEEGWEIVHMEPVARVGGKEDVLFTEHQWSNTYFAVLKRRKPGSYVPTQSDHNTNSAQSQSSAPSIPRPWLPPDME